MIETPTVSSIIYTDVSCMPNYFLTCLIVHHHEYDGDLTQAAFWMSGQAPPSPMLTRNTDDVINKCNLANKPERTGLKT